MTGRRIQRQQSQKSIGSPKNRRKAAPAQSPRARPAKGEQDATLRRLCEVVHQFGLVGGTDYDSKECRLEQLLVRIPADGGATVVFAQPASAAAVSAIVQRCCGKVDGAQAQGVGAAPFGLPLEPPLKRSRSKVATPCRFGSGTDLLKEARRLPSVAVVVVGLGACTVSADDASIHEGHGTYQYVINYDMPSTSSEYLGRLAALSNGVALQVVYTLVEERQLKSRSCQQLASLLRRARAAALADELLGGAAKATEVDSALEQLGPLEDENPGAGTGDPDDDKCDCWHCRGCMMGGTSYHALCPLPGGAWSGVEVVRVPLKALEDLASAGPLIAPRLPGHVCSMICLHCLHDHTPWDGHEHLFMPPELKGTMRVVLVLAEGCSWHHYPDQHTLSAGGVSWLDILDVDSMDRSDALLERLVDHEASLLGGHSERVVLMGASQGGGQSMLRFLRSKRRLGGWVGSLCHVPTAPHTPRDRDPLLAHGRPEVNWDRPIRLQAGEGDCVFPPGLVLRDAERLRRVGGFADVQVEVQKGLTHDGFKEGDFKGTTRQALEVPELLFVQKHLPSMVGLLAESQTPEEC